MIGTSAARVDLPSKLAGVASFVHDLSFDAMLHGRIVRSTAPGAQLVDCDEGVAASLPGVETVVRERRVLGRVGPT